jgi:hypothetical protein
MIQRLYAHLSLGKHTTKEHHARKLSLLEGTTTCAPYNQGNKVR